MGSAVQITSRIQKEESVLVGEVSDISLPTLLHLLEIENITGWLRLGDEAEISFHMGHVVGASIGPHRRLAALREILFRENWTFEVVRGNAEPGQPMHRLPFAMMDALHLRGEWSRIEGDAYRLVGDQRWCPTGGEIDALMDRLDGVSPLRDIVAATGLSATIAVESVLEALTLGLIEKVEPVERSVPDPTVVQEEPSPSPSPSPNPSTGPSTGPSPSTGLDPEIASFISTADFDDLLDFARRTMRNGDLATVEAAVRAALRINPESRIAQQNLRRVAQLRAE